MNTKKTYLIILSLVLVGFGIDMFLIFGSAQSIPHADTIPNSSGFSAVATLESDTPEQDLPKVHNLPPDISWPQTIKLRRFLSQYASDNNFASSISGDYREGSIYTTSRGVSILIDLPPLKQTLSVGIMLDSTLSIECGSRIDQKEASWVCVDDLLGESE